MVTMKEHRAVIFDLDDTLVDTIGPKWRSHKEAARLYSGLELTDEDLREVWGMPFKPMVKKLYRTEDFDGVVEVIKTIREKYPKIPHPGAVEKVEELMSRGIVLAILTSMSKEGVDHDFSHLPFKQNWFHFIQTEDDTEFHKPDHRVFEPALLKLGELGIASAEVMYVGDHRSDYQATLGAEISFTGVATGLISVVEFEAMGAKAVSSIAELQIT